METIVINKKTKAGKAIYELARLLAETSQGVVIVDNSKELDIESPYDPEVVKAIKESVKNKNRTRINPSNVWESL